jgi:dihydroorotase
MPHFDLLIRNGTAVLPWGEVAADIGVLNGRIAAIGASGTADETIDATGLHVLPGLIDPHVHLRDPGDPAIETIPTGTKAAVLGGLTAVFDMPNTSPAITSAERVAWKQGYVEGNSWCDIGLYAMRRHHHAARLFLAQAELAELEMLPGVCAIKVFAGSSTGDLLIEDDASLEAVMRSGRRPVLRANAISRRVPSIAHSSSRHSMWLRYGMPEWNIGRRSCSRYSSSL